MKKVNDKKINDRIKRNQKREANKRGRKNFFKGFKWITDFLNGKL